MNEVAQAQKLGILDFLNLIYEKHPEYSLIAVQASIDAVIKAFINQRNQTTTCNREDWQTLKFKEYRLQSRQLEWKQNIALKAWNATDTVSSLNPGFPIVQVGQWTILLRSLGWLNLELIDEVPKDAKALSSVLHTKAVTLIEEDASGAIAYEIFEDNQVLESVEYFDGEVQFKSKLRDKPIFLELDDEDEADILADVQIRFIHGTFSNLGIYLPAVWCVGDDQTPVLQTMPTSEGTIDRADWITLNEIWETDVEPSDEDDAE